ncbi:hypothetical protein AVEN_96641-1 [Araneus ventricosus]|uniref:Endonuclease/exonuclease/phosphatase domain-containing protein n=1 Tax=Araneus ventricosus TaxID=182803 RepID=A0A4Y2E823_ARAVE|nr:hypothetical protein AVEN_96641-1 [Araneus ventricosus]
MFTLLSWNYLSVRSKIQDLKVLLAVGLTLKETFLKSNSYFKLREYNCVRKDVDSFATHSGGVCILTSNSYPSSPLRTPLQAVAVQVHIRTLVTLPAPFLLIGDFNGHNTLWGLGSTNSRGRQLEQFISDNCLCLLNNDEKTFFHEPTRTFHTLDLAICSPELLLLLKFSVDGDLHKSDHFPLIISPADNSSMTYVFQRADWAAFTRLASITEAMISSYNISDAVQNVIDCIIGVADASIPKRSPFGRKYRTPWWKGACRDACREQRKLWNIFRRYSTTENLIVFKRARANALRIRRRRRRESWIRFISSITSNTSSIDLWKKVKAENGIYKEFTFPFINTGTGS